MPRCELMTITSTISVKGAVLAADIKTKRTAAKQTHGNRTLLAITPLPPSFLLLLLLLASSSVCIFHFNIHVSLNISRYLESERQLCVYTELDFGRGKKKVKENKLLVFGW